MKERPIIFSAPIIKAILANRCTMTRRVIKDPRRGSYVVRMAGKQSVGDTQRELELTKDTPPNFPSPYGQVGDRLWVRETWCIDSRGNLHYKATEPDWITLTRKTTIMIKWKPSIHMFRKDSRIALEITDIRVERLQEINQSDLWREGIAKSKSVDWEEAWRTITDFKKLWDSINAKRGYGWEVNPWVWVISFKLMSQ